METALETCIHLDHLLPVSLVIHGTGSNTRSSAEYHLSRNELEYRHAGVLMRLMSDRVTDNPCFPLSVLLTEGPGPVPEKTLSVVSCVRSACGID